MGDNLYSLLMVMDVVLLWLSLGSSCSMDLAVCLLLLKPTVLLLSMWQEWNISRKECLELVEV
jgi:hypothetical protein